jgi:hypothetical protein
MCPKPSSSAIPASLGDAEAEADALGLNEALGLTEALGESDGEMWTVDCPSRATVYESFPVRLTGPSR